MAKLPSLKNLERPTRWDLITAAVLLVGLALMGANFAAASRKPAGEPFPDGLTGLFVLTQLAVSLVGLLLLGKTAKAGTWWGNIAAILAMLVGMGGVLLAAALWAAA
ncbi:MAG TPA: hypothetical protein VFE33_35800 [Thermoanaerobaculia bacterium]|nr:hypothetical protein [Thermoanaerobaculia bacterium]